MTMPTEPPAAAPVSTPTLKDALREARDELIQLTKLARGGFAATATYSERLDDLIRRIYATARNHTDTPHAIAAVGGYGRKHMCLHSDVDLLIVFDGSIGAPEERLLKSILHPLWDLRLDLGHHVRELAEVQTVETDNPEFLVAIRDARFIDGDAAVFDQFSDHCLRPGSPWEAPTLTALRELVSQRHTQFSHTLYHLEPDIKDAPGALRDVSATQIIDGIAKPDRPTEFRAGRLAEAEDFMLRIRSVLHLERRRNLNLLSHELQESVAAIFGSPGDPPKRQVESLMSAYFHHARIIARSLAVSVKSLTPTPQTDPTPLNDDLLRWGDEISFTDGTRASLRPRTWLGAFEAALDQNSAVSDQVLTCIERHGERYSPEQFFPSSNERDQLLRVLRPRPGLYARLSEMHASGLLGRMFPEFQKVYCLVIRDFYHKYTVDEHTLRTISNLESLCTPTTQSRKRFGGLLEEVDRPELLVVALLFHDVGKWTNKNHSEEGVRMALGALRRIKLPETDIATVEFLIRYHLQMSVTAFRRDTDDPEVVHRFAQLVGTEARLKLLCLLTLVDVEAVGPDVMTPWKEELLWRLYVDTYNHLTLGYGDEVIDANTASLVALLEERPDDIERLALERFLDGLPKRYLRSIDPARVFEHARLARDLGSADVRCSLEQTGGVWELTVMSVDQPKLYSNICGVLSFYGMDILRGQAMSNAHGVAVDVFQFTDQDGFFRLNASGQEDFRHRLQDVVAGREDIDRTLRPKEQGLARRRSNGVKLVVHVDNQYSDRFTILEIVTQDTWELLYRISRVISRQDCDIDLVLISTEGSRAIDVFHLTKAGAKLPDSDADALRATLEAALEGPA